MDNSVITLSQTFDGWAALTVKWLKFSDTRGFLWGRPCIIVSYPQSPICLGKCIGVIFIIIYYVMNSYNNRAC